MNNFLGSSVLSAREVVRLGSSLSLVGHASLGSQLTTLNYLNLGNSMSILSVVRIGGSGASVSESARYAR